jgi:acetylornithine aminotransferase
VRGRGLWLALVLAEPVSAAFRDAAQRAGFLVNNVQPDAIRIAPALTMTAEEAQSFLDALPSILDDLTLSPAD